MLYIDGCMQNIYTVVKMTAEPVENTISNNFMAPCGSLQTKFESKNGT